MARNDSNFWPIPPRHVHSKFVMVSMGAERTSKRAQTREQGPPTVPAEIINYISIQLYSFVQLFSIILQEVIILKHSNQSSQTTNQTSTTSAHGSVMQPSLLVVVFIMVILTCFLLVIGILRNIHLLLLPWLASTFLSILTEAAILFFLTTHKKVRI